MILEAVGLSKSYRERSRWPLGRGASIRAVDDVSFDVAVGETLAIVGESGSGKSTVGRIITGLLSPDKGEVRLEGRPLTAMSTAERRVMHHQVRMIYQSPHASLDPKLTVLQSVEGALKYGSTMTRSQRRSHVAGLFDRVGLGEEHIDRYPHEFSGGQLQRVAIARAISTDPLLIVCDEAVSALDMSIRSQVLRLLKALQESDQVSYVFISHDLSLVRMIAHRVLVMKDGRAVEQGRTTEVLDAPQHDYTKTLLAATPRVDPRTGMLRERERDVRTSSGER